MAIEPVLPESAPVDAEVPRVPETASLETVIAHASELFGEARQQLRDVGELAFMELELAVESFKWSLWTMLLFAVASIMTLTLLMVSLLLLFLPQGIPAATVILLCGLGTAVIAAGLFMLLRTLTKRLYFAGLRSQLLDASRDEIE
tara:strand:- start:134553 stop:134990 length:438 start_codon:yes stop_codon:yes gene_type:complete